MFNDINLIAVLIAAILAFVVGGIWYSPKLFGTIWCKDAGISYKSKKGHGAKVYLIALSGYLISAFFFSLYLGPFPLMDTAIKLGLLVGLAWVATSFGINYIFASRSLRMYLIDASYHFLQFLIYGFIIGWWQ